MVFSRSSLLEMIKWCYQDNPIIIKLGRSAYGLFPTLCRTLDIWKTRSLLPLTNDLIPFQSFI
jgi:hypothetical protein